MPPCMIEFRKFVVSKFQEIRSVNLTGEYMALNKRMAKGGFRPLRIPRNGFGAPKRT